MNFPETVEYLDSFINYEKAGKGRQSPRWMKKLHRIEKLLEHFDHPEHSFKSILIAGTKGKGSTAAVLSSILTCSGLKNGLFTSPHLVTVRERLRFNGELINEDDFSETITLMKSYLDSFEDPDSFETPSYFEIITMAALLYFKKQKADVCVLEIGMGGRFDAVNSVDPVCAVITSIGLEHTDILGDTIEKIAGEKAGIMRKGFPVVSVVRKNEAKKVISDKAAELSAPIFQIGDSITVSSDKGKMAFSAKGVEIANIALPFPGIHQADNCAAAGTAALILKDSHFQQITEHSICKGIEKSDLQGRIDTVRSSPVTIFDTSHTTDSVSSLRKTLTELHPGKKIHALFNCSDDKDIEKIVEVFPENIESLLIPPTDNPRTYDPEFLVGILNGYDLKAEISESVDIALAAATKRALNSDGIVLVFGSFFLAGLAYRFIGADNE